MHQKQQLYIKQATACGYKRYEFTANLGDVLEVVSDNKLKICSSTNNTYCHADVTSATDYSPFGAPLPDRQYTAGLQATHTVAADHFNGSTSGWQAHGANSVVSSYCGNLRAVITNRGSQGQGMKKTFATTPGQLYKVSFLINVMAWPALVITDPTTGAELLRTPTNMPGQYSYTFMAQSTHTTIAFEEIVAPNSTILLCNFTLQEVGGMYVYGWNTHEKVNELAGIGNHTTADFGEFDTRSGWRWNIDPLYKKMPNESPYAVNHNSPIVSSDPKGNFGFIGAAIGAAVGTVVEYGSQVVSNVVQGKSLKDAFVGAIDWADVGITAAEGGLAGATGGLSLLAHGGFAAARVSVDATANDGLKIIGGKNEYAKAKSDIMKDASSELLGLGIGKAMGVLNIQRRVANSFINKGSSINQIIAAEGTGMLLDNAASGAISSIFDGIIHTNIPSNPFQKWGESLDMKHMHFRPVLITAKRINGKVQATPENEEAAHQQMYEELQYHQTNDE